MRIKKFLLEELMNITDITMLNYELADEIADDVEMLFLGYSFYQIIKDSRKYNNNYKYTYKEFHNIFSADNISFSRTYNEEIGNPLS